MNFFLFVHLQVAHSSKLVENVWLFRLRREVVLIDFYQALAICQRPFQVSKQFTRPLFSEFFRFPEHESRVGDSLMLMFPYVVDVKENGRVELDEDS